MQKKNETAVEHSGSVGVWGRAVFNFILTFLTLAVGTVFVALLSILSFGLLLDFVISKIGRLFGISVLRVAGVHMAVKQIGPKVDRPCIYISNHSSTLDLFMIVALGLPKVRFVAKYELMYNPFFFVMGKVTGQIFIKRHETEHAVKALQNAYKKVIRNGLSLFVAPEGTRKHDEIVGHFKKGAFRMALDLRYPIVPIFFKGARELCPGGSLLVRPGNVTATIHPPIDTSGWTIDTLDDHIEHVRAMYVGWEAMKTA